MKHTQTGKNMKVKKTQVAAWLAAALVITTIAGVMLDTGAAPNTQTLQPAQLRSVTVVEANPGVHTADLVLTGEVKPLWNTQLVAQVQGRVQMISEQFREGTLVDKNQWLLTLEQAPYQLELDTALAQQANAELELLRAQSQLSEARKGLQFSGRRNSDGNPLQIHELQLHLAKAQQKAAVSQVSQAKRNLTYTTIRAPYRGWVTQRGISLGSYVQTGEQVAQFQSSEQLTLALHLSEYQWRQLPEQWLNQPVTLSQPDTTQTWHGSLVRLSDVVTTDTRQRVLYVDVPAQEGLYAGRFVSAVVTGKPYNNLLKLPKSALTLQNTLWWIDDHKRLQKHHPTVAFIRGQSAYVSTPEQTLTRAVVYPTQRLMVNQSVMPNIVEAAQ
jgi:RND family efflux transporter MFP subunit